MKRVFSMLLAFTVIAAFAGTSGQVKWAKKDIGPKARAIAALPGGTLDPTSIPKYVTPLVIPPAMPRTSVKSYFGSPVDYYEIAVRQFVQQILPAGMPATTVWGYGSVNHPGTFNYPSFTIEAKVNRPVRVKWINQLVDASGNYLPHLLAVDQTLHWANPSGPKTDTNGIDPTPYRGPVPMVVHVHGAHTADESDGFTEAWYLPNANNIPAGYAIRGSKYNYFRAQFLLKTGVLWTKGNATFQYPNNQRSGTLWYHDHSLGMTRLNVYAGPAGFYLIRGGSSDLSAGVLPGPAPALGDAAGMKYYEIPIAVQDRSFNSDGSLFYPSSREFFDGFTGPYAPASDVAPIWNPEFFGNAMVVNGKTWPNLDVEPRRYRLRLLNGCNARFLVLKMVSDPVAERPVTPALPFWQIGTEGGFLPAPVVLNKLLMSPAERADVIVDFSGFAPGTHIYLINEGPDEPFGGGEAPGDFDGADVDTTGQVMRFTVVDPASSDTSTPPAQLTLPKLTPLGPHTKVTKVSLNELGSAALPGVGPTAAVLGTIDTNGMTMHKMWSDPITENPKWNSTEIWEIYNFTIDAHPIHLHEVMFQVVNRQALEMDKSNPEMPMPVMPVNPIGPVTSPESWETGFKDTVIAYPGQVTRIKAKFDLPGLFVWHCHIVEHEDNEMMRPLYVGPKPPWIQALENR